MNIRKILEHYRKRVFPVDWALIEQDYALSWVLYGISKVEQLEKHLVFKGGTCLKKCYFGDYRFSQDLDFSTLEGCPRGEDLEILLQEATSIAENTLKERGHLMHFSLKRYHEKHPHPGGQEAFIISVAFPWHKTPLTPVMIEITFDETVWIAPNKMAILHTYEEEMGATLQVYTLEEIIAEKIAALLSFGKKLHERGWSRSRARDYYDLWRIFTSYQPSIATDLIPEPVLKKCARKNISFQSSADLFDNKLMEDFDIAWEQWVRPLVPVLPDKTQVIKDLRGFLVDVFKEKALGSPI